MEKISGYLCVKERGGGLVFGEMSWAGAEGDGEAAERGWRGRLGEKAES